MLPRNFKIYIIQGKFLNGTGKPYSWFNEQMIILYEYTQHDYMPKPEFF